jgi:F-type H+-transporting ATPase subunit b
MASLLAVAPWWQLTIMQIVAFVLLILILAKFVGPLLKKKLGERTKGIEDSFGRLEKETADARRDLEETKRKLAEIDREIKRREEAAAADAQAVRAQAQADAKAQAQALMDKARREIQTERDKAVLELRQEAERLTLEAADHLIQSAMTDEVHRKLVDGYLSKIDQADGRT